MGERVTIRTLFLAWRLPGRHYGYTHWVTDGRTACGRDVPDIAEVYVPPNPVLSCLRCQAAIKRRDHGQEGDGGNSDG